MTGGHGVRLEATDRELLLYTHYSHYARVKTIQGGRWDRAAHCWRFPKTARCYDAILAEFKDDLLPFAVERPQVVAPGGVDLEVLQAELARRTAEVQQREAELHEAVRERDALRSALAEKAAALGQLQEQYQQVRDDKARLEAEVQARTLERFCEELARELAQHDHDFVAAIEAAPLGPYTVLEMGKALEARLRAVLEPSEPLELAKLIELAGDKGLLDRQGVQLAHMVRVLRNRVAHSDRAPAERLVQKGPLARPDQARAVIALLADALLWPQLATARRRRLRVVAS
jgi:hypothetical protein